MATNVTPETAQAITALPFAVDVDPSGGADSTYTTTCGLAYRTPLWYTYTPPAGVTAVGLGFQAANALLDYFPSLSIWTGSLGSLTQHPHWCWSWSELTGEILVQLAVTPGTTYYLQFVNNLVSSPVTLSNLQFRMQAPDRQTVTTGSLFISNDTAGFPAVIVDPTTGNVLDVVGFSAFEQAAMLPNGRMLIARINTSDNTDAYELYTGNRTLITTITSPIVANQYEFGGVATDGTDFYVSAGVFAGGGTNGATLYHISSGGTVGASWTLPAPAGNMNGMAVSGTTVYWTIETSNQTAIRRFDLSSGSALSDLVATEAGGAKRGRDLEVTADGDLLSMHFDGSSTYTVRRYNTSTGALEQTYGIGSTLNGSSPPRFRIDQNDPTAMWVMNFPSLGSSTYQRIRLSDGTVLTSFTIGNRDDRENDQDVMFAPSQSCPLMVIGEQSTETADDPPDEPPTTTTTEDCPCPPPDRPAGGAGSGPFGGGGSGASGTNEGGDGWTPAALCDPGGTVHSYPLASPGESMAGVTDERVWAEVAFVEFDAANTEAADSAYWAINQTMPDLPASYGGRKDGRAIGVSKITRGMSDDNGTYVGSKVTVAVNDKDRAALRARLGDTNRKYVWEREGIIRIASETNRRLNYATPPRELFRGVSHDINLARGFSGSVSFEDRIASQFGQFGPDRSFSSRLMTLGIFPACPRELVGKPQQWILGEVSDEGAVNPLTGLPSAKGLVPIWLIGSNSGEDEYHVAAHDCCNLTVYGSDGLTPPARVLLTEGSDYTVHVRNYTDHDTGLVHRMTVIRCASDSVHSLAHKNGQLNMAANVAGVLGANGLLLTDLFLIYQYIFEHIVLPTQESLTGEYVGTPQWADGRYMVDSDSFATAQAFSQTRIGGRGYQGGFVLGGPHQGAVTLRELLRRMSNSGDCWFTWTAAGQLRCVLLDDATAVDDTDIITEPAGLRAMPTPEFAFDEVENPVLFSYDYDDDKQKFRVAQETVEDTTAHARMGRPRPSQSPIAMRCVRDATTARDVAARRLLRRKYPPAYYPIVEPLVGLDRDPGDILRVTSQEGVGSGCTERPMWIKETSFDPKSRRVTHVCRDLTDIIGPAARWADGELVYETASAADQAAYAFWADEDGLVPDGDEVAAGMEWR